jgi:hypothetical protein
MTENLTQVTVSLGGKKHSVSLAAPTLGALRDAIAEPPLSLPRPEPHRLIAGSLRLDGGDDTPLPAPRRAGMPLVVLAVRSGAADVAPINHIARVRGPTLSPWYPVFISSQFRHSFHPSSSV